MKYVDLRTGERVDAPEEYDPNLVSPGQGLDIDNIESLRTAGESEDVLNTLQSVGSPASYQAAPDAEVISVDDPRFPWDALQAQLPGVDVRTMGRAGGEQIRGASKPTITSPPNVFSNEWWPYCSQGKPVGFKWNPPTTNGYNGQYYVKGNYGSIYLWKCGGYVVARSYQGWSCCGYAWFAWDPTWNQSQGAKNNWAHYTCK